jgi:histone H3/H4
LKETLNGVKNMSEISVAAITRIVKSVDPNIRVSVAAKEELLTSVEEYAGRIAELAVSFAHNANRNTVLPQDITSSKEQLMMGIAYHQAQITRE